MTIRNAVPLIAGLLAAAGCFPAGAADATRWSDVGQAIEIGVDGERAEVVLRVREQATLQRPLAPRTHPADALCARADGADVVLFVGDGDGRWEHWRLHDIAAGGPALHVRTLHTGPDSELCALGPTGHWLFVAQEGIGVWALAAGDESADERLLLPQPPDFEPESLSASAAALNWTDAAGDAHEIALAALPRAPRPWPLVTPRAERASVARFGDAADDPAVFSTGDTHLVVATDKQGALLLLDADGGLLQRLETGRLNNVDLRALGDGTALVTATDRTHVTLAAFRLHADRPRLEPLRGARPLSLADPYGLCMYRSPAGELHAFANDTDGRVVHVRLHLDGASMTLEEIAAWQMDSQTEGCVVDDARGVLWLGEEARGVWRYPVSARTAADGELVIDAAELPLTPDVEGIARLREASGRELLLVSSQGDDSYALFDVTGPAAHWLGSFRIGADLAAGIDGSSETDGLELHPGDLGGRYPGGVLVVQDGRNRMPPAPQNFKYVALADVLAALAQSANAASRR